MQNEEEKRFCQKCGKDLTYVGGEYCDNCGALVPKKKYEKIYYDKLKSSGEDISLFLFVTGMLMIFGIIGTFLSGDIGLSIILLITTISFFVIGKAANALFICIAEMAKNTEKQTELLNEMLKEMKQSKEN